MSPAKEKPKSTEESKKPKSKKDELQPVINIDTLCDENWKCDVVFIYEGDKDGLNFINILQQIPIKQIVGCVKIINKNDILKDVKKSGGKISKKGTTKSQKSKDEDVELTDEQNIMKCIKESTTIPGKPLAGVIKKYLMKLKVDDINDRIREKAAFESSQKKKANPVSKGTKKDKREELPDQDETPHEEFLEKPPLFIILLGFNEHDLPIELIKQDIPICAVMKMTILQHNETVKTKLASIEHLGSEKFNMTWLNFWRKYDEFMNIPENADLGNDLPTLKYRMPYALIDSKVNLKDKKNNVLNELTNITNYVRKLLEQYKLYSENLTRINVSEELSPDINKDFYETLIQMVPLECVSIPVILFSLIEQVCHWTDLDSDIESKSNDTYSSHNDSCNNGKDNSNSIIKNNNNIELTDRTTNKRNKSQSIPQKHIKCQPVIIRHNDEHSLKTFHLEIPELDFNCILIRFLSKLFLLNAWLEKKNDQMQKYFFEFQLQRLFKLTYKDIHIKLFYIYLHWYILCKMKSHCKWKLRNSKVAENGTIIDNSSGLPYNFSYTNKILQDWLNEIEVNDQINLSVSINDDIDERIKRNVNNADQDNDITIESGNSKSNTSTTSDSLHIKQDHCKTQSNINFKGKDVIKKERHHNLMILKKFLYCPEVLCLCVDTELPTSQNYLKSFTNYKYIEEMAPVSLLQSLQEALFNYSQVQSVYYYPSNKILIWFHNSKHFIFEDHKTGTLDSAIGFRDYYSNIIEPEEEALLKQNEILGKSSVKPEDQIIDPEETDKQDVSKSKEIACVYDVGKKMIQFNETRRKFSSLDGSSVVVTTEDCYRSSQMIHICISKIDTEMHIHLDKLLFMENDNYDYNPITDTPIETMKLFVKLSNEILLNVRVQEILENMGNTDSTRFIFSDLTLTLPNGLIIQVVKNKYDNNNVYIRQSYTAKGPNCNKIWDENCRCFDRSGSIIIFKSDGTIDVIYGSTALAKINKLDESVINKEEIIEEVKGKTEQVKPDVKSAKKKTTKTSAQIKESIEPQVENAQILPYKIAEHAIKTWSGISYVFKDNLCTEVTDNNVSLRTRFQPYKQLYMDRNDGVKCTFTDDGKLLSTYDDGTKLTINVHEEPEILFKQDSQMMEHVEQELYKFDERDPSNDTLETRGLSHSSYFKSEDFNESYTEMFTSYIVGCIAEHPNYATVEFSPSDDSIKLTLPENLIITIHDVQSNGSYEFTVNVNKKATIKFTKQAIRYESNILKKYKKLNATTITPIFVTDITIEDNTHFCKTTDTFHRMFAVDKVGEIMVQEPNFEDDDMIAYRNIGQMRDYDSYYENSVPRKLTERFFVVNEDFSGHEVIHHSDIQILDKDDEKRFKSVDVTKNPTNGRVSSKTSQYYVYKSHSDTYLLKQKSPNINPSTFQRVDLSPPWTPAQSPWFFIRTDVKGIGYRQFSYSEVPRHDDSRIQAVVIKTIQQISDSNSLNGLEIILNCLERYKKENEKLFEKYKQQGYTDLDVDVRLKENKELICSIKKEIPLWNVISRDCNICKQPFGSPNKRASSILDETDNNTEFEKVIYKTDY